MASIVSAGTTSSTALNMSADTSGVLQLASNNGTTAVTIGTDQSVTFAGSINAPNSFGFKNRIINGAQVINQRATTITDYGYATDRWSYNPAAASKASVAQSSTAPTGFNNSLLVTSSAATTVGATDVYIIEQKIEGYNIADLGFGAAGASSVTISFWVRSSLTGTFGGALGNAGPDRSYPFTYTISSANTWEQKTVTIAGDTTGTWATTNGSGFRVIFSLGCGSSRSGTAGAWTGTSNIFSATGATSVVGTNGATFYLTGIQLEKGSTATSFDYRDYGTEYNLCQRYFQLLQGGGGRWGSTQANFIYTTVLPVSMRASPTLSVQGTVTIENYAGNNATVGSIGSTTGLYPSGLGYVVLALSGASGSPVQGYGGELYVGSSSSGIATSAEL